MFVVKPRITAFICLLIILADIVLVIGAFPSSAKAWVLVTLCLASGIIGVSRRSLLLLILCPAIVVGSINHIKSNIERAEENDLGLLSRRKQVFVYGTVCDTIPTAGGHDLHAVFEISRVIQPKSSARGRVLLSFPRNSPIKSQCKTGDILLVRGSIARPTTPTLPWDYNEVNFFARLGATARLRAHAHEDTVLIPTNGPTTSVKSEYANAFDGLRSRIIDLHRRALGNRDGDFLASIVIGNRNVRLDESITVPFRNLGLSHMVAASGFNLTIVVGVTWLFVGRFTQIPWLLNGAAALMMLFYVGIAGLSPSVQRAAFMCSALLFAQCFLRSPHVPAVIGLSLAITVMIDPFSLFDVGLQLSYVATVVLIALFPLNEYIREHSEGLLRAVLEALVGVVAVQLGVLPLQMYYFWQVGLLSVPANLLIAPAIPIITVLGFFTSSMICVLPAGCEQILIIADQLLGAMLKLILLIAGWLSSCEGSVWYTGAPPLHVVPIYYCLLIVLLTPRRFGLTMLSTFLAFIVCILCLLYRPPLSRLLVVAMVDGVLVVDTNRNALVIAPQLSLRLRRAIGYLGCRPTKVTTCGSGVNMGFTWEAKMDGSVNLICAASNASLIYNSNQLVFKNAKGLWIKRRITNDSVLLTCTDDGGIGFELVAEKSKQ